MTAAPLDDVTLARATITVGLDRMRELALGDTTDTEDTADVLQALHHGGDSRDGALDVLATWTPKRPPPLPRFHTDGKSGVLLTSFSLPLAVLVTAVPGHTLPRAAAVLVGAGVVGLVAGMLVVLLVVCQWP